MYLRNRMEYRCPYNCNFQSNGPGDNVHVHSLQIQHRYSDSIFPRNKVCGYVGLLVLYPHDTCPHYDILFCCPAQAEVNSGKIHSQLLIHCRINLCPWLANRIFEVSDNWYPPRWRRGICTIGAYPGVYGIPVSDKNSLCIYCSRVLPRFEVLLEVLGKSKQKRREKSPQLLHAGKR